MKKILILGMSATLGGIETYIFNLIRNINKEIYTFDFLVVDDDRSVFEKEINTVIGDGKEHFFYSPDLKKSYFKATRRLKNFYDSHHYDAIYMNTCTAARINYCIYAIRKYGTPLITHSHSGNATSMLHMINNNVYKKKCTELSRVKLACSEMAYNWLFSDKMKQNCIVPNGVDLSRFRYVDSWRKDIRKQLNVRDDEVIVGTVGRFSPQKNQIYFLELSKRLGGKYKILIIGDGELKDKMLSEIKEAGLENRFIILPVQSDIEKYYSAMDVFALPSNFEGLPIVAVEAQAEGLPCILSTNISRQTGLSENCTFLNLENPEEWVTMIKKSAGIRFDGVKLVREKNFDSMQPVKIIERMFQKINGKEQE